MDFKDELRSFISAEEAKWIRRLRVEEDYSFRAIARECSTKWKTDWGENQIMGEDICAVAIEVLNDNASNGWQ